MDTEMVSAEEARVVLQVAERMGQSGEILARLARTVVALHARVVELEKIAAGRTTPPNGAEAEAMRAAGLKLARRWHAVDRNKRMVAWPEVSR